MASKEENDEILIGDDNKRSTAADVIAELNSEFSLHACGPSKTIYEANLEYSAFDPGRDEMAVKIAVRAHKEGLHGEMWDERRAFRVTLDDITRLSETAPRYRQSFAQMAEELTAQLAQDRATYKRVITDWCDAGLPAEEPVVILKPLRLTYKMG